MHIKKIVSDITILFTGYNIKPFAVLAIESFLLHNPNMRKNIIYFDDESTDGTKEELQSRGIKVITWLPNIKEKYNNYEQNIRVGDYGHFERACLAQRVSFILYCAAMQIKTTYLYVSDADMVFFDDNYFLYAVEDFAKNNCIISGSSSIIPIRNDSSERCTEYMKTLQSEDFLLQSITYDRLQYLTTKAYPNQMLMELRALKNLGVVFDGINNLHIYDDTGCEFYRQLMCHNIPIREIIKYMDIMDATDSPWFLHLRWVSSIYRMAKYDFGEYEEFMMDLFEKRLLGDKRVEDICDKLSLDIRAMYQEYINNIYASK